MSGLMGKDLSKESRSEEKKKKISKSSKESVHKVITSAAGVQEMENGDLEQEGRRLFLDDLAKRKEKRLKEFLKATSKRDQGVVEGKQQQSGRRSMPVTQDTADNFVNQDFDANSNSNGTVQDGSEYKIQNENCPNGSRNHLQSVSHVLPSSSQSSEQETDRVSSHTSHCKAITNETDTDIEQALISKDVLGDTSLVTQRDTPCGGPSQAVVDSCSVTDPELDCSNSSGEAHSRIDDNGYSHINRPSGHQQELAAEAAPLVDQDSVEDLGQTDHGLLPSHAPEGVCGRSVEGTSSRHLATATLSTAVPDSSLAANSVTQHGYLATQSRPKKPSTGDDLSSNAGQMDSPCAGYITDSSSSYPSFPPSQTSKPESTTPSAMQIVVPGSNQKEEANKLTVDDELISKAVTDNTLFLEKLSKYLDRESRVIKCWKHLAFVLKVPAEETRKFDMFTEHSPTEDMFNYLAENWHPDLEVRELKIKLEKIYRNDVIDSLIKGGYRDEEKVADLISGRPKFIVMLSSKLDTESRTIGNWKSLATHFGIRKQVTEQFGSRGSGPTAALFQHMSTADGLKDLTMGELRSHFVKMERKDIVNILTKHKCEDSSLVRKVAVDGSELLADIGERLNKEMRAVKNWRNLAYRLEIPHEEYDAFDTSKVSAKSPTKMLFEWLQRWKPNLTVKDLLTGLKQIDRYDVVDLVRQEVAAVVEKDEADSRQRCSEWMQVDGPTHQSTAKQALWKLQQLHHYPDKSHKKTDLFTDLERKAAAKGLRIVDNKGNGNCMFSALCRQLEIKKGPRYSEMELRTELVQYLKDHPTFDYDCGSSLSLFNFVDQKEYPTWKEYLKKMERDGTWGDHLILQAAARHLNCVIHIISSHPEFDVKIEPDSNSTTCDVAELLLGHIYEYHYVSLEADLSVPSYPSQLPTTNQQVPVSTYAGHPPSATHQQTYGNQQSQGHHQSERYSKEMKESMKVRQLPLRIYSKICMKLNIRRDWSFDDFRMVAEELGMDRDTTEFIGQHRNPTDSLFVEYYTYVTVLQLINILHKIERLDVAAILEEWMKDVQ